MMARRIATLAAFIVALTVAMTLGGCAGIPQDGRYQTHDAGRSNNRAEAAPTNSSATRFS